MGNWMTVSIQGTCDAKDIPALAERVNAYHKLSRSGGEWWRDSGNTFTCLSNTGGLAGLGDWTGERIDRTGNLAERDYTAQDVADTLRDLMTVAPSLRVKVHCGGDYEDTTCVATVTAQDGTATIGPPEVKDVGEIPPDQIELNLYRALYRH